MKNALQSYIDPTTGITRYTVEASDLEWAPGEWPSWLHVNDRGHKTVFIRKFKKVVDRNLVYVRYVSQFNDTDLIVYNT